MEEEYFYLKHYVAGLYGPIMHSQHNSKTLHHQELLCATISEYLLVLLRQFSLFLHVVYESI